MNRTWEGATWRRHRADNRYFNWIALLTIVMLIGVLATPDVARLFSFVPPPLRILPVIAGCTIVATLWFECVKSILRHRKGKGTAGA